MDALKRNYARNGQKKTPKASDARSEPAILEDDSFKYLLSDRNLSLGGQFYSM
jgi:hypothetical protein